MSPLRLLLYALPPCMILAGVWSARESTASRARRGGDLVAMLPGGLPSLNPFLPASAMDQELVDLVYEPLLRAGTDGFIQPVLASHWVWTQQMTIWFATEETAAKASDHLHALNADRWISLGLDEVSPAGSQLLLKFASPEGNGPDEALRELVSFEPLPVDFVRLRIKEQARAYNEHFMANAVERSQIRRAWFDAADQTAEFVICGTPGSVMEELRHYYNAQPELAAEFIVLDRIAALREPVLEFRLTPDRFWPDQTPVTSGDVAATVNHVLRHGIPLPDRDGLDAIHAIETPAPNRARVIYRQFQGAALCAWMRLPILPAAWLETQGEASNPGHAPGTGPFRPSLHRDTTLVLDAAPGARVRIGRIRLLSGASSLATQAAFASGGIDLFWPPNELLPSLRREPSVVLHPTPPRRRLLVMWNLRSPMLEDARVREALALATDRPALIRDLLHGAGGLHDGLFQPGLWFSQPPPPFQQDLKRAAELLDAAGWYEDAITGGRKKPGADLALELLTTAGNPQREDLARMLAAQWSKLGIKVSITALPLADLVGSRLMQRRFDAAILGQEFATSWDQRAYWHSFQTHLGGLNFSGLAEVETDLMLETLATEFDPAAVPQRARPLEQRILSHFPFLPLFTDQPFVAIRRAALPVAARESGGLSLSEWVMAPQHTLVPSMRIPVDLKPLPTAP